MDHIDQIRDHNGEIVIHGDEVEFARLDPGKVQDIVHQAQQVFARGLDVCGVGGDGGVVALPEDPLVHRVDGSADLMGHIGQEIALCPGSLLRRGLGFPELVALQDLDAGPGKIKGADHHK